MIWLWSSITLSFPGTRLFNNKDRRRNHGISRYTRTTAVGTPVLETGSRQRGRFRLHRDHPRVGDRGNYFVSAAQLESRRSVDLFRSAGRIGNNGLLPPNVVAQDVKDQPRSRTDSYFLGGL